MQRKFDIAFQYAFQMSDGSFIRKEEIDKSVYSDEDSVEGFVEGWNYRSRTMKLINES